MIQGIDGEECMYLSGCAITHTGKVRSHNEDNFRLFDTYHKNIRLNRQRLCSKSRGKQAVAAVLDGVGGEQAGELAALAAAETLVPLSIKKELIEEQVRQMNRRVCSLAENYGHTATTAAILYFDDGKAISCNLGDSRVYMFRDEELELLTHDHTEGQRMVDMNILEEKEARREAGWHRLTQYLGVIPDDFILEPFFGPLIEMKKGDIFVLASDGLTDMVMDEELRLILKDMTCDPNQKRGGLLQKNYSKMIAEKLLTQALVRGGKDNTTIVVIEVKQV